jgi:hypothetical protein
LLLARGAGIGRGRTDLFERGVAGVAPDRRLGCGGRSGTRDSGGGDRSRVVIMTVSRGGMSMVVVTMGGRRCVSMIVMTMTGG